MPLLPTYRGHTFYDRPFYEMVADAVRDRDVCMPRYVHIFMYSRAMLPSSDFDSGWLFVKRRFNHDAFFTTKQYGYEAAETARVNYPVERVR